MVDLATFVLKPALITGFVLGLYEAITLMKDVSVPQHRLGHAFHAFAYAFIAVFFAFNVDFLLSLLPFLKTIPLLGSAVVIRVIIGIITAIKVHATSRVVKSGANLEGMSETWFHTFVLGGLVGASPYIWAILEPALPTFLT